MDRLDPRDETVDGIECAACGRDVARERVRLLARRDDLAFVELGCDACGSVSLAMVEAAVPTVDRGPAAARQPIGLRDVRAMRQFLATWNGDLRDLLSSDGRGSSPGSSGAA